VMSRWHGLDSFLRKRNPPRNLTKA
jgi:hypothetical protein